jgi:Glycosyl transferase family 2
VLISANLGRATAARSATLPLRGRFEAQSAGWEQPMAALRAERLCLAYRVGLNAVPIDPVAEEAVDQSTARVTVVTPTLHEARKLPQVLERIPALVDEVVIVDGLSTDDAVAIARRRRPDATVVLESTPGKCAALRAGFPPRTLTSW